MDLPPVLAGPILRRVEPNLVAVWVALRDASTVKLALYENQIGASDADDINLWFRTPDPGVKTIRIGDKLHLVVVTLRLPSGKTLIPERLYSYNLEIISDGQTEKQTLQTLKLLGNDPPDAGPDGDHTKHLALGYEPELLPCLVLPPKEITDLKLVHGSCRDIANNFPDGLAWLDDLLSTEKNYTSALKRPHQLFMTGDQIYADDVPRPMLSMLSETVQTLFGSTAESLPFTNRQAAPPQVETATANLTNFPAGARLNLIRNEAGMTSNDGASHLLSFGEFCAMYLYVWSNVCWGDQLGRLPPAEELPPKDFETKISSPVLRDLIKKNDLGENVEPEEYSGSYTVDVARLIEFHRTLPKVRRALANVPTYLIFDDHEISDDWYLNPTWRDRVLGSPLGSAIVRNGMLAYGLFQGWGNDPVKFEPRVGVSEKQPHEQLLEQAVKFMPAGAATGPDKDAARQIEILLGLDLRNQIATDGSYAETNPPLKWHYTVPGQKHQVLVLDCRTRRAYASRMSPPGNIGLTAQVEQIPERPDPADRQVWIVLASLPVMGPPIFDELFAPLLFRIFDVKDTDELQKNRGQKRMPGTNPDAVEAWCFDPKLFEALLKRLAPYSPVLILSGDVHYSASNAMSYWYKQKKEDPQLIKEPARIVQFISSGLKNIMPATIVFVNRSFAFAQKMIRVNIGAERLGWEKSPGSVQIPSGTDVSPRLRAKLKKSPVLVPTFGWPSAVTSGQPDWAWRVSWLRDLRADKDRPPMVQPASLFPLDTSKKNADIERTDLESYAHVAERHARQLDRLTYSRQVLFASSLGVITFQKRTEQQNNQDVDVLYAIQDMYTVQPDPQELVSRPKPLVYTRHETPLRDLSAAVPAINPPKPK